MSKNGIFVFPGNVSLTPYEFGNEFAISSASDHALRIINFLCPIESEYTNTPDHLFSAFRSSATIIFVKLMPMVFGVHTGYAMYIGASLDDINEINRGFSDTFSKWVPDVTWYKECELEMKYCANVIHRALLGRAERLKNIEAINELIDNRENVPMEFLFHCLERSYAIDYPERDPICHIALFEDLPTLFVEKVIGYYQEFYSRAGLTKPFIGYPEKEYFKFVVGHAIRAVISHLTKQDLSYANGTDKLIGN